MDKKRSRYYTIQIIEKNLKSHLVEWGATTLTVIGSILNANLLGIQSFNTYSTSFYVFLAGNLLWISFALKHKHWGVFTTFSIIGMINFLAILKNLSLI